MIDDVDFKQQADKMMLVMQILADSVDLQGILDIAQTTDAIGPFVDPTAYRDMLYRKGNMHDIAKIAELLLKSVEEYIKIRDVVIGV